MLTTNNYANVTLDRQTDGLKGNRELVSLTLNIQDKK